MLFHHLQFRMIELIFCYNPFHKLYFPEHKLIAGFKIFRSQVVSIRVAYYLLMYGLGVSRIDR